MTELVQVSNKFKRMQGYEDYYRGEYGRNPDSRDASYQRDFKTWAAACDWLVSNNTLPKKENMDISKVLVAIQIHQGFMEGGQFVTQRAENTPETKAFLVAEKFMEGGPCDFACVAFDTYPTEAEAQLVAVVLSKKGSVPIESYVKRAIKGPSKSEKRTAFEKEASKWNFIKDTQFFEKDHSEAHRANTYGHYDTQNASIVWNAACAYMLEHFQQQQKGNQS